VRTIAYAPTPPARRTGTLTRGGQPPGSTEARLPGVAPLSEGFNPCANGHAAESVKRGRAALR
jgi:hypothetical protein